MTAIRKSRLQYIHFQCLTIKTTKIGYSNDRFGFNSPFMVFCIIFLQIYNNYRNNQILYAFCCYFSSFECVLM